MTSSPVSRPASSVAGTIVALYKKDADGWHMSLVEPSVPEPPSKRD